MPYTAFIVFFIIFKEQLESREGVMMEQKLKEIAECCICTDLFTDPRMLPCIHTFCLNCINAVYVRAQLKPGDSMPCPVCRTPFIIPSEGMTGLKRNFFMDTLVEVVKISKPSETPKLCEICADDNSQGAYEIPEATQYCFQCQQHICNSCSRDHSRMKLLKEHQVVPLGHPLLKESIKKFVERFCDKHENEKLKLYCSNCKEVICMKCFAAKHNLHKCSDVEAAGELFRKAIANDLEQLKKVSFITSEKIKNIVKAQMKFQSQVTNVEKTIIKRGNDLKKLVDECTRSLLRELGSVQQKNLKQFEIVKEEIEQHKALVDSLVLYSSELMSSGSSTEICRNANDLHVRSEGLQKSPSYCTQQDIPTIQISFENSKFNEFLVSENIVGAIKVKSEATTDEETGVEKKRDASPFSLKLRQRLVHPYLSSDVYGVTKLEDRIYVLSYNTDFIVVFEDKIPFHYEKKIEIKKISNPTDIASSEKSKCLYVLGFDGSNRCIWKITNSGLQLKWLPDLLSGPWILSVSPDDRLMIIGQTANQLKVFGSNGKLVQTISLPDAIRDPYHCIQKPNGEFIVSHKDRKTGQGTISQLSRNGQQILHQFQPKDSAEQLDCSCYLSLDSENNVLFVADMYHDRVILFDSDSLQWIQIVLKRNDENLLYQRTRLFYDSRKRQLIVGHYGKPEIFEFCKMTNT